MMRAALEFELDLSASSGVRGIWRLESRDAMSGGCLIEVLMACACEAQLPLAITGLECYLPLWLGEPRTACVLVDPASQRFVLRSRAAEERSRSRWEVHVVGSFQPVVLPGVQPDPSNDARARPAVGAAEFYAELARAGLRVDDHSRVVEWVRPTRDGAEAEVRLSTSAANATGMVIEPSLMDAVFQLVASLEQGDGPPRVGYPGRVGALRVWHPHPPDSVWLLRVAREEAVRGTSAWSCSVTSGAGEPVALLSGVTLLNRDEQHALRLASYAARAVEVVRDVTGVTDLSEDTDLAAAGVSSLAFTRVLAALADEWGAGRALEHAFERPTPRQIAACFALQREEEPQLCLDGSDAQDAGSNAVSWAEQRLWYLERHTDVAPAYNESVAWRIQGTLDVEALQRSVALLGSRHPALRTAFVELHGTVRRQVAPEGGLALKLVDVPADVTPAELERSLVEEVRRPFALDRAPLARATLYRRGPEHHVLLLVAHHIVCDGQSVGAVLCEELGALYAASSAQRSIPPSAEPPVQMADYARWEQALPREYLDRMLQFWLEELEDVSTVVELPTDHPRPRRQTHRGAHVRFEIDAALFASLSAFARGIATTPFVVLLSAFQVLVQRHSGQQRFVIGVPFSLRQTLDLQSVVGCLVNTVPVRAELTSGVSLREIIGRTREHVARAWGRKAAPFDQLVARLRCERSLSRNPLIQIAFSFDENTGGGPRLAGCSVQQLALDTQTTKFDLSLHLRVRGDRLEGEIQYAADLFEPERIRRMAEHYRAIVRQLVTDAGVELGGEWLLGDEELRELSRFEQGDACAVDDGALLRCLETGLSEGEGRVAVVSRGRRYSFEGLAEEVRRLAAWIERQPVTRDAPVALAMGRGFAWVCAVLAVVRLGRGYLPIDPQTPPLRALQVLTDCEVELLLHEGACAYGDRFDGIALDVTLPLPPVAGGASRPAPSSNATFYAITTSGSTGEPKTAAVSYGSFANLHQWYSRMLALDGEACVLVPTSVGFDLTQKNLFAAVAHGARLVLRDESAFDPSALLSLIEQERVSVVNCTPTMFYALLEAGRRGGYSAFRLLRSVVLGGEPIDMVRLEPWLRSPFCAARLWNTYGPTECTDVCAAYEIGLDDPPGAVPIGRPIDNVRLTVRDAAGRRVPVGVTGELCIAGAALGKGYLGAHAQQRFVGADQDAVAERMYRTGDSVRFRSDGHLLFIGRTDQQIKVRGYRVEPEEIERALCSCPGVRDAAVVMAGPPGGAAALHAFYVSQVGEEAVSRGLLRSTLEAALPRYMLPSSFTRLDSLPLTRSGKIDRKALPAPQLVAGEPPQGEMEVRVHALWKELLGLPAIGAEDDFFEVGGHSLLAVHLAERVQAALGMPCGVSDVFEWPTIRGLAAELLRRRGERDQAAGTYSSKPGA